MVELVKAGVTRVLLVEDSALVRVRLHSLILESCPALVIDEVGSVTAALASFRWQPADAVVLDLNLEGEDGCRVLTEVKRQQCATLVIVLTAFADAERRSHCLGLGADFFFDKMTEFDRVPSTLADFLDTRGSHAV